MTELKENKQKKTYNLYTLHIIIMKMRWVNMMFDDGGDDDVRGCLPMTIFTDDDFW
jgi:hypothetical protein